MSKMTDKAKALVLWFDEIGIEDVPLVGGKSASLGEMRRKTGVPVPDGFATTAEAYRLFIRENKLDVKMNEILGGLKDPEDTKALQDVGAKIRKLIATSVMPSRLEREITAYYKALSEKVGERDPFVAVRSSATAEDLPDASFAGQQETYLNVRKSSEVIERTKECFASLFTDRAIYYRVQKGFDHMAIALSSAIQLMAFSKASGVIFTLDVSTGDRSVVLIEAGYGLGEYIVQGKIDPDEYYVKKADLSIVKTNIPNKTQMLIRKPDGGTEDRTVPKDLQGRQVLSDEQIKELAKYAISIEEHYQKPMDLEWALDERTNKLCILQARPETVWSQKKPVAPIAEVTAVSKERKILAQGLPASPGLAAGKGHVIASVEGINEFQKGEILVTEMTAPDWVPAMRKSAAIVTNSGGMTCHAAIVSRELGIPCIVGTAGKGTPATKAIPNGTMITVDAKMGMVYEGIMEEVAKKAEEAAAPVVAAESYPVTGTRIYANVGEPEIAEKTSALPCDGVGLLRQEFVWASDIGEHPLYLIKIGHPERVIDKLAEAFRKVCAAFYPRPVIMRFSDFKSSEYRSLKGGEEFEPVEPSALMGWRGASRYYDPKYLEAFKLEVRAVRKCRDEFGMKNLHVMVPFCRRVEEMEKINKILIEEGLERGPDFKVWLMAEIPSNCLIADKYNKYVDGYSIGSNDLTMTILGCDRDNETVARLFDERDLAVKRAIRLLIKLAHRDGKTVSICGQSPSVYPEYNDFLVQAGIDSISVNPDAVVSVRKRVASVEQRLLMDRLTGRGIAEDPDLDIPCMCDSCEEHDGK